MKLASVLSAALSASALLAASAHAQEAVTGSATLTVSGPGAAPSSGTLTVSGPSAAKAEAKDDAAPEKAGTGTITLSGTGTHTGTIKVQAGEAQAKQEAVAWTEDLEAAKAQAAKDGKDILVDFTGSDWCGWCIKLKQEVFDQGAFAPAAKDFVFVELDFPARKAQAPEVKARNKKLQQEFGIQGFPSILLLDAKGRPFAKTGYQPGGPEAYLKHLAELKAVRVKRDAAWTKAEGAQGVEKAKLLAEGLAVVAEDLHPHYAQVVEQIKALDPQDATGLVRKAEMRAKAAQLQGKVMAAFGKERDTAAAFKVVDDFIAENKLAGEAAQQIVMGKLNLCPPVSAENIDKAVAVLDQVVALGADTELGKQAAMIKEKQIPMFRARFEAKGNKPEAQPAQTK